MLQTKDNLLSNAKIVIRDYGFYVVFRITIYDNSNKYETKSNVFLNLLYVKWNNMNMYVSIC